MKSNPLAVVIAVLAFFCCMVIGCDHAGYWGYALSPNKGGESIEAQFAGLEGKSVAVLIFADETVRYEYPSARIELACAIAGQLRENVKDVKVIDPRRVVRYQDTNIRWNALKRTELAGKFDCDFLLYVSLTEFSMTQPGSMSLSRGRITANTSLHQRSSDEANCCVWRGEEMRVVYPPKGHGQLLEDERKTRKIRHETTKVFAVKLARNFYKHKLSEK